MGGPVNNRKNTGHLLMQKENPSVAATYQGAQQAANSAEQEKPSPAGDLPALVAASRATKNPAQRWAGFRSHLSRMQDL
jgi:hypothetical protein